MLHRLLRTSLALLSLTVALPALAATPKPAVDAQAAEPAPPWGRLVSEDGKTAYPLDKDVVIVGNAAPADVVIDDKTVAPRQIRLTYKGGLVTVEELGSRFGTLLNGTALKKGKAVRILVKSQLALGAVTLNFEFGTRPGMVPPSQPLPPKAKPHKGK
jgi:hypothetical protein